MLDFTQVKKGEKTIQELAERLSLEDLQRLTDEMVDQMLALIAGCTDDDVVFVPDDPKAYDPAAATDSEVHMPWTLGHVIVHTTASAEESAALAAELARGVPNHGRSRSEVPWETVTTIAQCRHRLEESRRMRLASLQMWPEKPDLSTTYRPYPAAGEINAMGRFLLGLQHDDSHVEQVANTVKQAKAARTAS